MKRELQQELINQEVHYNKTTLYFTNLIQLLNQFNNDFYEEEWSLDKNDFLLDVFESLNLVLFAKDLVDSKTILFNKFNDNFQNYLKTERTNNIVGESYYNLEKHDIAIKYFKHATKVDPNSEYAYVNLGRSYNKLNKNLKAIQYLNKSIEINPVNAKSYYVLGIVYLETKNYKLAIVNFDKAMMLGLNTRKVFYHIALAFYKSKKYVEAIKYFEKTKITIDDYHVQEDSKAENLLFKLGKSYIRIKEYDLAMKNLLKIVHLIEDTKELHVLIAICRYKLWGLESTPIDEKESHVSDALLSFNWALEVDPYYYPALFHKIKLLTLIGKVEEANKLSKNENFTKFIENKNLDDILS